MTSNPHLLVIDARFYESIADELVAGAVDAIEAAGSSFDRISVPGVLEIPAALAYAVASDEHRHDGYVLLGCVIRGETTHYDIVAEQSARAVTDLAIGHRLAVGNGILTVENRGQANARARRSEMDKGGGAARAAIQMVEVRRRLEPGGHADG